MSAGAQCIGEHFSQAAASDLTGRQRQCADDLAALFSRGPVRGQRLFM
jgi:hypothetical protein